MTISLNGKTFGKLTVLHQVSRTKSGHARWKCKCDCGNTSEHWGQHLTAGRTKSCGCLRGQPYKNKKTKS